MRTNYVLIDFENVQPESLSLLRADHFKAFVFVGANQAKVPFDLAAAMQHMGERAEYVKIAGSGPNALDFHIAYYIGQLASADPDGYFHIISKDTGFDPLVKHLKSNKILAARFKQLFEIPLLKVANGHSPEERFDLVLNKLQQMKACKPRAVKTLRSTVAAVFQKRIEEGDVSALVQTLEAKGYVIIKDSKVSYALPHAD